MSKKLQLILIRGLPGSGKSTLAHEYAEQGFNHYEADMYFINKRTGEYEFDPKGLRYAHTWCKSATFKSLVINRVSVVVSNTFTTKKEMQPYLDIAQAHNIPVKIITMTENYGNIHNVPSETIEKMKARWEDV